MLDRTATLDRTMLAAMWRAARRCSAGIALVASLATSAWKPLRADEREAFFESRIRPVLAHTCFPCHGGERVSGGLRLDSRESLVAGGDSGPALVPGKPEESLLLRAVRRSDDVSVMPPDEAQALSAATVADFAAWVAAGAVWPSTAPRFESRKHWAWQPLADPLPPVLDDASGVRTSIDRFIRAAQVARGLAPRRPADKRTLIRRVTFDLTGLPPTTAEIDDYLADTSPSAFEVVVERLLSSPAYGEKWGRHWLDVVRYADTAGETADYPVPEAWRYRNYVIDAFNADLPYDDFLREQIAGDILAHRQPDERFARRVAATGFLAISRRFGFDSENYHHLTIQDSIDTLGQTVLGLSLGCARCHDHKFDPITRHDYYALYGIFASTRYAFPGSEQKQRLRVLAPLLAPAEARPAWRAHTRRVAALTYELARLDRPRPSAVLRSLDDWDGDFEIQAPASGGSRGVLVPPWRYAGPISVTTAAQSPFVELYPPGKVGASVPAGDAAYLIGQAIPPGRGLAPDGVWRVNLDFRVGEGDASASGRHRFALGPRGGPPLVEVLISAREVSWRSGELSAVLAPTPVSQWQNLQLELDLAQGLATGRLGAPGAVQEFAPLRLRASTDESLDEVSLSPDSVSPGPWPAIDFDNFGLDDEPLSPVSTEPPGSADLPTASERDAWRERLTALTGRDGDLEFQVPESPPQPPWGPGPQSVAQISPRAQSPFRNIFPAGRLGMRLPNRANYDGFGQWLTKRTSETSRQVAVSFDFCSSTAADGGQGSWRYYLGHGPGTSAAVELFWNEAQFFRRSAQSIDPVAPLHVGPWYQVQLVLDLAARTYTGALVSASARTPFAGQLAEGWDGTLDHTFIDSYGHLPGVRPGLDADNFYLADHPPWPWGGPRPQSALEAVARQAEVAQLRERLEKLERRADAARDELTQLLETGPVPLAYAVGEGTPQDAHLQLRGEPEQLGDVVPRGFIAALGGGPLAKGTTGSGRLELAEWLTRPENALTPRVIVNRIWQGHFGRGLVATPNDFGARGLPPTHPDLLDHLASHFVRQGWSIKALHRLILDSATYQQASLGTDDQAPAADGPAPGELYRGFPRRRLSAEELRDSLLAVSGELDSSPAVGHPFPSPVEWGFTQHSPFRAQYDHRRRSIYLMTSRLRRHPFLALFDGADPNASTPTRLLTTVPTQALYFLNDGTVHELAVRWAERLRARASAPAEQIGRAYYQALGRPASAAEQAEALEFFSAYRGALGPAADAEQQALAAVLRTLWSANEFLYVD